MKGLAAAWVFGILTAVGVNYLVEEHVITPYESAVTAYEDAVHEYAMQTFEEAEAGIRSGVVVLADYRSPSADLAHERLQTAKGAYEEAKEKVPKIVENIWGLREPRLTQTRYLRRFSKKWEPTLEKATSASAQEKGKVILDALSEHASDVKQSLEKPKKVESEKRPWASFRRKKADTQQPKPGTW